MIAMNNLQKSIIRILQEKKECSRKELSSLLSVTPAAITLATAPLLTNGFIEQMYEVSKDKAGRKEIMLSVNPSSFFSIGIDVDDDNISLIKLNGQLTVIQYIELTTIKQLISQISSIDLTNCVGMAVSLKSYYNIEHTSGGIQELISYLKSVCSNVTVVNNIASLAYAYKTFHPEDESFVLIKYGPGVGSACFIKNQLLQSSANPTYELGKTIFSNKLTTVEESIGYSAIADTKQEAVALLKTDQETRDRVLQILGLTIYNVNTLLQLDKVLVSGDIFKDDSIFESLLSKIPMSENEKEKVSRVDNYDELNLAKSALTAQYLFFVQDK